MLYPFKHSTLGWPDRDSYLDHQVRFNEVRVPNQLSGCCTPVGRMLSLMITGQAEARKMGPRCGLITWEQGDQALRVKDSEPITLEEYKSYVRSQVGELRDSQNDSFFGAVQELHWDKLEDNWTNDTACVIEPIVFLQRGIYSFYV
jgi:hypothetical protein